MELAFGVHGRVAGTITRDGGRQWLTYDQAYVSDSTATPLSLSLPVGDERHSGAPVEAYMRGLLPDNVEVRRRWARGFGLRDGDTLGLVAAIGRDCAGGVVFDWPDRIVDSLHRPGGLREVTDREVADRLRVLRTDAGAWHSPGSEHWSLAGAQSKFTLAWTGDGWAVPTGAAPSTHIVKPGITTILAQALIEHVSMRTVALVGERVAPTAYVEFDGEPAIVIERFDRVTGREGATVRLHTEDMVQTFGLDPSRKYEADQGPGIARIAEHLRRYTTDGSLDGFVRAIIVNYLLGAPDAHAKNYSLMLLGPAVRLAPLYDVASGLVTDDRGALRYRKAAMSIGGETRFGEVEGKHWDRFADIVGLDVTQVRQMVRDLSVALPDAMRQALTEIASGTVGRDVIAHQVLPRVAVLASHTIAGLDHSTRQSGRVTRLFLDELENTGPTPPPAPQPTTSTPGFTPINPANGDIGFGDGI